MPLQWEYRETEAVTIALAQLTLTLWLEKQRKVCEARHSILPTESLIKENVQWGTRQPFLTTNHVRDFHQVVVHDVCEVICRQFVGTLIEHFVVDDVALYHHFATYHVIHMHLYTRLYLETHHILLSVGNALLAFFRSHGERVGHLQACVGVVLEVCYLATFLLQFLRSVESYVRRTLFEQDINIFFINIPTLALTVRTVFAAEGHAFVELYAEPSERFDDIFLGTGHETMRIGIFYSEYKFAAMLAREEIIKQCGSHAADMQRSRRTGRKTHSDFIL